MKIYDVEFDGMYPVGDCLIIAARNKEEAKDIASKTIIHTDTFKIKEVDTRKPKVIKYLSGDY